MRERLIDTINKAREKCRTSTNCKKCIGYGKGLGCISVLIADYLLADGWVRPPVWVDNIVWFYVPHKDKPFELRKGRVSRVEYTLSVKPLLTIRYNDNTLDFAREYWGNRAFATEGEARTAMEEAEAALKGGAE